MRERDDRDTVGPAVGVVAGGEDENAVGMLIQEEAECHVAG